jgi:hypothetical protein
VFGNGGGNTLTGHNLGVEEANLFFGNPDLDPSDWDPLTGQFIAV